MSALDGLRYRLDILRRALFDRRRYREELNAELRFHLDLETMQREHDGASADDAARGARKRFGNPTRVRETLVDGTGVSTVDALQQDVRFALRALRKNPGFALVAVLTLAIGIGANTAIFSAVNALLMRPLPFAHPEQLMSVGLEVPAAAGRPARHNVVWSYPKFAAFRDAQHSFQDLTIWTSWQSTLRGASTDGADLGAERVQAELVDSRYLPLLGVRPVVGRGFVKDEDTHPGGPKVAVLSDALWSRRFNSDPRVVGRTISVDNDPYTVVGVLPRGFKGMSGRAELLVPVLTQPADAINEAWNHTYNLIARRKAGVSVERATAEVVQLGARVDAEYPHPELKAAHWGADARPLDATRVDPTVRRALLVLLGAVGLVLLIACANVANLLLVRATARKREIAVRLAIGAGRRRLVRQLVTESLVLATIGGAASLLLAWWGVRLISKLDPANALRARQLAGIGAVNFEAVRLDVPALLFAGGLVILTGLLFGLVPALMSTRPSLTGALKDDGMRSGTGARATSGRSVLAAAEIALALVLLAGSGLMLRSLGKLIAVSPGVDASNVLTLRLGGRAGFPRDSLPGFYDQVIERLGAIPGVTGVGMSDCPPLNGGCNGTVIKLHDRPAVAEGTEPDIGVHWITPAWPSVMHVPLKRGRLFTAQDRVGARKSVIVTETAARRYWPNDDPIGKPVSIGQGGFWNDTAYVVGVVGDVRYGTLDSLPVPESFLSYYQSPTSRMMLYLRTSGDPLTVAPAVRRALHDLAPDAPLYDMRTMESRIGDAMAFARLSAILLAAFAVVALALATIGVYGVISYAAAERTREMGLRVALGATRGNVARLVLRQGVGIAIAGGTVGIVGALAATRVLRSMLYGVTPNDPGTFAGIAVLLLVTVVGASWTPARRASRVPPADVLRNS